MPNGAGEYIPPLATTGPLAIAVVILLTAVAVAQTAAVTAERDALTVTSYSMRQVANAGTNQARTWTRRGHDPTDPGATSSTR